MTPLSRRKLTWPLLLSILLTLFAPAASIPLPIFFLSPCIILAIYRFDGFKAILLAFCLGTILDFFSLETRLGLIGSALAISTALLYPFKNLLFADKFYTLPLMTFLFSMAATVISCVFLPGMQGADSPGMAFLTEAVLMPFADALYALSVFVLPEMVYRKGYRYLNS